MEFRGSITPPARPLSTLSCALTERQRMTRGHRDSLRLRCRAFSSPSPCRFIPALSPAVHSDLAALAALAAAHQHGAACPVEITLRQGERLADPQPCPPEHDDDAAQPKSVGAIAGRAHHRDDLLDGRRVGWIAQPFVPWRSALMESRHGRGRAAPTGAVQRWCGMHDVLLETVA